MHLLRGKTLAITLGISSLALAGTANASTTGFDPLGNPWQGLQAMLAMLLAFTMFAFLYLFINRTAQRTIDRQKEHRDIDSLIRSLESRWLGAKAARALGETADERAMEPLIEALGSSSVETREAAADALGIIGDERAIERLTSVLDDRYVSVREHALSSISKIKGRTAPGSVNVTV